MVMTQHYEQILVKAEDLAKRKKLQTQSAARNIFRQYGVAVSDYPRFIETLDEDIHQHVFLLLTIAAIKEQENRDEADRLYSQAGMLLEHVYHFEESSSMRDYYMLLASLVYYSGRQYSKSYLLLAENVKPISQLSYLLTLFLRKDFYGLERELARWITIPNDSIESERQVYTKIVAMSLSCVLRYLQYGDVIYHEKSVAILNDAMDLATLDRDMSLWWILRLLQSIVKNYYRNALWSALDIANIAQGRDIYEKYIYNLLLGHRIPVVELFPSQILAVQNGLTRDKCVISLPTSSGKTRIAEIAIVKQLTESPNSKILYLAPFRSLAYEVEGVLARSLEPLGYVVSHLYGGCFYTLRDSDEMEASHVIIATPEKAKAIYRYSPEAFGNIGLIVFDEGHLIGSDSRSTKNELFSEELHVLADRLSIKLLLLSAVLPNVESISTWISGTPDAYVQSEWRPASQRYGLLLHDIQRKEFHIYWNGGEIYNRHFMDCAKNKNVAIAQAATRFSSSGTILIYVAQKRSTKSIAKELSKCNKEEIDWGDTLDWKRFELICLENHEGELYQWARKGILCHHGALQADVRLAMETLLRSGKAKYIVATNTLAQGVNLGVSMVIFATTMMGRETYLSKRDFWNIVGRAGRAFVETEGTVLFYMDANDYDNQNGSGRQSRVNAYFDTRRIEEANSGLLFLIRQLLMKAEDMDIGGTQLIEMVANDHCTILNDSDFNADAHFDDIDDSLLSIMLLAGSETNLDDMIRKMLAYIQARDAEEQTFVQRFIHARCRWLKKSISPTLMHTFSGTGIPIREAQFLNNHSLNLEGVAQRYVSVESLSVDDICEMLMEVESIFQENENGAYNCRNFDGLNDVLHKWISGESLNEDERNGYNSYFTYMFPWLLNATSVMFREVDSDVSQLYSDIAAYCQYGMPNLLAIKLYLQGIRSRHACTNLSQILDPIVQNYVGRRLIKSVLSRKEQLIQSPGCTELTKNWIQLLSEEVAFNNQGQIRKIMAMTLHIPNVPKSIQRLFVLSTKEGLYVSDECGECRLKIDDIQELYSIANMPGLFLERVGLDSWCLSCVNPNFHIEE